MRVYVCRAYLSGSPDSALAPMNAWLPETARAYLRHLSEEGGETKAAAAAAEGPGSAPSAEEVRAAARQGLADLDARLSSSSPLSSSELDGSISRLALDVLDRVRRY